jgi:hypothetical protein
MPSQYTFDHSVVPGEAAAYYTNTPVPNVTAFNKHAPQALPGPIMARVLNDTLSKIPPPNSQDHGWGHHTAAFTVKVLGTTPFDKFLKGDPATQFRVPVGKPANQSDDVDAQPRTMFGMRVRRILDYLNTIPSDDERLVMILGVLNHLYANLSNRLPTSQEIAIIEKYEVLMAKYFQSIPQQDVQPQQAQFMPPQPVQPQQPQLMPPQPVQPAQQAQPAQPAQPAQQDELVNSLAKVLDSPEIGKKEEIKDEPKDESKGESAAEVDGLTDLEFEIIDQKIAEGHSSHKRLLKSLSEIGITTEKYDTYIQYKIQAIVYREGSKITFDQMKKKYGIGQKPYTTFKNNNPILFK